MLQQGQRVQEAEADDDEEALGRGAHTSSIGSVNICCKLQRAAANVHHSSATSNTGRRRRQQRPACTGSISIGPLGLVLKSACKTCSLRRRSLATPGCKRQENNNNNSNNNCRDWKRLRTFAGSARPLQAGPSPTTCNANAGKCSSRDGTRRSRGAGQQAPTCTGNSSDPEWTCGHVWLCVHLFSERRSSSIASACEPAGVRAEARTCTCAPAGLLDGPHPDHCWPTTFRLQAGTERRLLATLKK